MKDDYFPRLKRSMERYGLRPAILRELRDGAGYERLGSNVLREIQDELRSHEIRWYPDDMKADQNMRVWLYLPSSPFQKMLRCLDAPSMSSFNRLKRMIT